MDSEALQITQGGDILFFSVEVPGSGSNPKQIKNLTTSSATLQSAIGSAGYTFPNDVVGCELFVVDDQINLGHVSTALPRACAGTNTKHEFPVRHLHNAWARSNTTAASTTIVGVYVIKGLE